MGKEKERSFGLFIIFLAVVVILFLSSRDTLSGKYFMEIISHPRTISGEYKPFIHEDLTIFNGQEACECALKLGDKSIVSDNCMTCKSDARCTVVDADGKNTIRGCRIIS